MKISIITVTLNSKNTIISTLNSILSQTYKNIEHILSLMVDQQTEPLKLLKNYQIKINLLLVIAGIYEAMNKGIKSPRVNYFNFELQMIFIK